MTVSTDTASASYTGNGSTQIFPIPFYFLVDTDIKVSKKVAATGVISTLTLNSDYTLSGAGNQAGGSATLVVAPASDDQIFIERNVIAVQETAYPVNSPFPAASHEKALDRLTMLVQQLQTADRYTLTRDPLGNGYDMDGNRLTNVADAVDPQDVPSLVQVQRLVTDGAVPGLSSSTGATLVGYLTGTVGSFLDSLKQAGASVGAAIIGFLQAGTGAVARTAQNKLREVSVSPEDFGAVRDGVTDDAPAIAKAIAYLATLNGGTLDCQQGTYAIGSTILVESSHITIKGKGGDQPHDSGSGSAPATVFKWIGASGGEVVKFQTPAVITANKRNGGGMENIHIDGNSSAGFGLVIRSWNSGTWRHNYVLNVTSAAYKLTCWTSGVMAENTDSQRNYFDRCDGRLVDSAAVRNAVGFYISSDTPGSAGNSSFNTFHRCGCRTYNAYGFLLTDADNNIFIGCGGTTLGSSYGVLLNGCYGNYFQGFSGTCRVYGTASGAWANSISNVFYDVDESNGTVYPVVDSGCTLQWHGHKYGHYNLMSTKAVMADSNTSTLTQAASLGTETLRIGNGSQNHIRLTDGTNEWGIRIDSSGNLLLYRYAGTGYCYLGPNAQFGTVTASGDVAINGYITIKDAAGTTRKLATIA